MQTSPVYLNVLYVWLDTIRINKAKPIVRHAHWEAQWVWHQHPSAHHVLQAHSVLSMDHHQLNALLVWLVLFRCCLVNHHACYAVWVDSRVQLVALIVLHVILVIMPIPLVLHSAHHALVVNIKPHLVHHHVLIVVLVHIIHQLD
jgi:hypothetical protein